MKTAKEKHRMVHEFSTMKSQTGDFAGDLEKAIHMVSKL